MPSVRQVDFLNLGLMGLAFGLALALPFDLFLFSYAILGPLHYITEISWLRERDFFLKKRTQAWWLVAICFILSIQSIILTFYGQELDKAVTNYAPDYGALILWGQVTVGALIFIGFCIALFFNVTTRKHDFYLWLFLVTFIAVVAQFFLPYEYSFFSLMLPTIIHVSVFTAIFILSGALKQNIPSGYAVFVAYIVLCALFFVPHVLPILSDKADQSIYMASGFQHVNEKLLRLFGSREETINILNHPLGFQIQAFIAFVYTFHYLNWFSKTSLVGWHRVTRRKLITMLALWAGSVGLYIYDYRIGLSALFFFSLLHVVLEFPLNHKSIAMVTDLVRQRVTEILQKSKRRV